MWHMLYLVISYDISLDIPYDIPPPYASYNTHIYIESSRMLTRWFYSSIAQLGEVIQQVREAASNDGLGHETKLIQSHHGSDGAAQETLISDTPWGVLGISALRCTISLCSRGAISIDNPLIPAQLLLVPDWFFIIPQELCCPPAGLWHFQEFTDTRDASW